MVSISLHVEQLSSEIRYKSADEVWLRKVSQCVVKVFLSSSITAVKSALLKPLNSTVQSRVFSCSNRNQTAIKLGGVFHYDDGNLATSCAYDFFTFSSFELDAVTFHYNSSNAIKRQFICGCKLRACLEM